MLWRRTNLARGLEQEGVATLRHHEAPARPELCPACHGPRRQHAVAGRREPGNPTSEPTPTGLVPVDLGEPEVGAEHPLEGAAKARRVGEVPRQPVHHVEVPEQPRRCVVDGAGVLCLGPGSIVSSEIEAPNMLANLI